MRQFLIAPFLLTTRMFAFSPAVSSSHVRDVMSRIDRADFCPEPQFAYEDAPQAIGYRATISAPHMHEYALSYAEELVGQENLSILDVGSGSGYLTACFAELFGATSKVTGIEHIAELVAQSRSNIAKHHRQLLDNNNVRLVVGDGRQGYPPNAPYDFIHVGAAILSSPTTLVNQLKPGGIMVAPIELTSADGSTGQFMYIIRKDKETGKVTSKRDLAVRYVPLTDESFQRQGY